MRIAIVGVGPRGASVLERLVANADASGTHVDIHVIEPYGPGGGAVWRPDQPRDLLMNVVSSETTLFTDGSVACTGPIVAGPSLYEWARDLSTDPEAAAVKPWTYTSRALHGRYLEWFFGRIRSGVTVHQTRCVALDDATTGTQRLTLADGEVLDVDAVVLALGHTGGPMPSVNGYHPPANPLDVAWSKVPAGEPVLVRGLGLNFFDCMAMLTTGRGGRFDGDGGYHPSGAEPILYVGSRRGVPLHARGEYHVDSMPPYRPRFFTPDALKTGALDFQADVWPLVAKEAAWAYYRALGPAAVDFADAFAAYDWDSRQMRDLLAHEPARLDFAALDKPLAGRRFADRAELREWMLAHLAADRAAALDAPNSPLKAMAAALRDLRGAVRRVVSHRGLTGRSYRDDLEGWFAGFITLISSGPPVSRIAELAALAEAGIVEFIGPDMTVHSRGYGFEASSPQVDAAPVTARTFIDARVPEPDLLRTTDPLLRHMLDTGQCRPHTIDDYVTGGMDVTESPFHVIDATGRAHPRRFAIGIPIEGVQWTTAIGARPWVNSALLLQTDAVARGALGVSG
jgi:uncharacterized NAD(P)/FAD-binding protein YdhS